MEIKEQKLQARAEELIKSANAGDAEAQYQYAQYLIRVEGRMTDPMDLTEPGEDASAGEQALQWFCFAANQGHANAQYSLGQWYFTRPGSVAHDLIQAYMWYKLAATHSELIRLVSSDMTPDQIAKAERLVAEWKPDPRACEVEIASSN